MKEMSKSRLRVVSNFDDGDCGAGEIHTRARNFKEISRRVSSKFCHELQFRSPNYLKISCREEGVSRTDRLIIVKSVVAKVNLVQIAQLS